MIFHREKRVYKGPTTEELEAIDATERIHAWFREQVLESIKPWRPGPRRPVFRPTHQEIAMNQPWSDRRRQTWKEQGL